MKGRRSKIGGLLAVLVIVASLASACGVPQKDVEALKQQLETAKAQAQNAATLQTQVTAKEQEITALKQELEAAKALGKDVAALQAQITAKEQELATLKKNMVWTIIPNAPPRQPAPPPTPGAPPPPPPPTPPPAKTVPLFFYVDTVTAGPGESKYNVDASRYCVINGVFKRGMHIVWRMEVVDTTTSKVLQKTDVSSAVLKLPHGETKNFNFGRHGATEDAPWFWTAAWDAPPDYPLGVLDFTIEVTTNDGKTGTFKQIPVSLPARGIESRLTIIE
ncbi:MAG: hypothetical protein HY530_08340 [Chloroflexi bacterium]|nr:hypothetical protein [Chloroflexota bacterium]